MRGMRNFECGDCGTRFSEPCGTGRPEECPKCKGTSFCRLADERGGVPKRGANPGRSAGRGRCARRRAGWARVAQSADGASATPGVRGVDTENMEDKR
jgi:hypothetical protein